LGWILTALKHHGDYSDFAEKIPISEEALNEYMEGKDSSAESADAQDGECADAQDGELSEEEHEAKAKAEAERQAELERQKAELEDRLAFVYPHGHLTSLPAKLSVSKLTPTALDVFDNGAAAPEDTERARADEKKRRVALERLLHTFDREPCFDRSNTNPTPAQQGTATHEFMQFCSFEAFGEKGVTEQNVANECDRLVKQHFLSEDATKAIRKDELKRFFESGLYRRLRAAAPANVHRETRFHLFLPASDFTANEDLAEKLADEQLAVQGVIDLFFTDADGKLVLCDYKTDRLSPQALRNPALAAAELARVHGTQLSYYARALEEICGRRPDEILIYSLHLGRDLDISHLI
ncbi:MAG: PD-(D/E)XK nuclease family protein, partial [Clostridia bacterium]|nr:PD-(D/E)XK nuclease family protein [Clostridia bacterium]